jgi:GMP synthase-like glutamine amidotransferase
MMTLGTKLKRVIFVEMMGVPGSYDASVYDHFEDKDQEGLWFVKRFGHISGILIDTCNICVGESLPSPTEVDGIVLAGSYNSVHDHTEWQKTLLNWLPEVRHNKIPILAVCGSHQLMAHSQGAGVIYVEDGPFAGTFPVRLTEAGKLSPIMSSISDNASFQYANSEHVVGIPEGCTLLASSSKVPIAALDYGDHCYSTQFHPEGSHKTLGAVWRYSQPELIQNYHAQEQGDQLVANFLQIVLGNNHFAREHAND